MSADELYMRPYDPDATVNCPKCSSPRIATRWFGEIDFTGKAAEFFNGIAPGEECIGRKCGRCGFAWPERPISPRATCHPDNNE